MTATSHALTGAVIGLAIGQPLLAIPLAFASHFVMDSIPHFDFGVSGREMLELNKDRWFGHILLIDVSVMAGFLASMVFILDGRFLLIALACSLAAISPDLAWGWRFFGVLRTKKIKPMGKFSLFHKWVQWKEWPGGLAIEIFWIIIMAVLLGFLAAGK